MTRKIVVFIGTRPEGIKLAPVIQALASHPELEPIVVLSGQHKEMLQPIIERFQIPVHHELHSMYAQNTLATLSSHLLKNIDALLSDIHCDAAVVQGDTTTMLMAALVCFYRRIPVAHIEAGLRTSLLSEPFPEEANRRLASHLATWHFAPTTRAKDNLKNEGIAEENIHVTGNTVIDALHQEQLRQQAPEVRTALEQNHLLLMGEKTPRPFVLITCHRRENFGEGIRQIASALRQLATAHPQVDWVLPIHLNPVVRVPLEQELAVLPNLKLIPPQGYPQFVWLLRNCQFVLTDSGGVQEEAPAFGKLVLVMRTHTERPEGVDLGWTQLVGACASEIVTAANALMDPAQLQAQVPVAANPYGDGKAASRVVLALADALRTKKSAPRDVGSTKRSSQPKRAPLVPA